jgi:hypothetical protein
MGVESANVHIKSHRILFMKATLRHCERSEAIHLFPCILAEENGLPRPPRGLAMTFLEVQ